MKILAIHNRYLTSGGEDQSHDAEVTLLRNKGHSVHEFVEDNKRIGEIGKLRAGFRTIWSIESYNKLNIILNRNNYDLILTQNYFPLHSPSIFYAAKKNKTPIIFFLRNYRLSCINGLLLRNNHVCEDCINKFFPWPGIVHKCYQSSLLGSISATAMLVTHRLFNTWRKTVDGFITLTHFSKNKLVQAGLPADQIYVRPNFLIRDPKMGLGTRNGFLFIGRLSEEKGIDTLINCWENHPLPILTIIGDGPKIDVVKNAEIANTQIKSIGLLKQEDVYIYLQKCIALVMPSHFYETFGRTIIEAFSTGTPVIASNRGAMAELVKHEVTGLLFTPEDPNDLANKVKWACEHPMEMVEMGRNARIEFESKYTVDTAYDSLMEIYETILTRKIAPVNS